MSKLEEVKKPTPILDAIEERSALVGGVLRQASSWFRRIRNRRTQKKIDKRYHDRLRGLPERDDP
jgi:hypothetical protein